MHVSGSKLVAEFLLDSGFADHGLVCHLVVGGVVVVEIRERVRVGAIKGVDSGSEDLFRAHAGLRWLGIGRKVRDDSVSSL